MMFAGVIYAWSILKAPLALEFNFSKTELTVNYTLTFCFFCVGGIVNGRIRNKINIRGRLFISAASILVGFFLASRMQSLALLYVGYGILGGFGIGMIYNNVVSEMTLWFKERKGLCSGILMLGFGASAMILGSTIQSFIDSSVIGWRGTFLILGIVIFVVTVIAGIIVKSADAEQAASVSPEKEAYNGIDIPPSKMVKKISFWAIFFRSIFTGCAGSVLINFSRDLSLDTGATIALATTIVGILSICNGLGRLIFGFLIDLLGYKKTLWISNFITLVAISLNVLAYVNGLIVLLIIGAVIMGLAYGSMPSTVAAIIADFYGPKFFSQNFGIANFTLMATAFMVIVSSIILESLGGYIEMFIFLLALAVVGCILTFFIKKPENDLMR